jgi:quinol monooxygenase YgiN
MTFRKSLALVVPALLCLSALESAAQAPDSGTLYVVTYVELKPTTGADAVSLLKAYRDALRKGEGNLRAEVLRHASRPGQFVVLSAWKDQKAFEAQRDAARNKELRDKLQGLRNSPADDRIHTALSVGADGGSHATGGLNIVTHVDVVPPRKDDAVALLKTLGDASRREEGNLRYEIVQQTNRPNHFTVVESWKSREAFEAHGMASHVREFRDKLAPMSGALYDERLYEGLI